MNAPQSLIPTRVACDGWLISINAKLLAVAYLIAINFAAREAANSKAVAVKLGLKYILATIILVMSFAASAMAGPLEDARAAINKGGVARALRLLRPLAEKGNTEAQYWLGVFYLQGRGIAQDYTKAAEWYRKSAEHGNADALNDLGVLYFEGKGVHKDYVEAAKWFRRAANQGRAEAQQNLGACTAVAKACRRMMSTLTLSIERDLACRSQAAVVVKPCETLIKPRQHSYFSDNELMM
jgi:hypothetical protein